MSNQTTKALYYCVDKSWGLETAHQNQSDILTLWAACCIHIPVKQVWQKCVKRLKPGCCLSPLQVGHTGGVRSANDPPLPLQIFTCPLTWASCGCAYMCNKRVDVLHTFEKLICLTIPQLFPTTPLNGLNPWACGSGSDSTTTSCSFISTTWRRHLNVRLKSKWFVELILSQEQISKSTTKFSYIFFLFFLSVFLSYQVWVCDVKLLSYM